MPSNSTNESFIQNNDDPSSNLKRTPSTKSNNDNIINDEGKDIGKIKSLKTISPESFSTSSKNVLQDPRLISPYYADLFSTRNIPRYTCYLRPGSRFIGTQLSNKKTHEVEIELKEVDLQNSQLSGYLHIQNLTTTQEELITFFKSEIIGPRYSFLTRRSEWGSDDQIDTLHWNRFKSWRNLPESKRNLNNDLNENGNDYRNDNFIFMRWKEYFLVPDYKIKEVENASYAGFYYICFNQNTGSISGLYYHQKTDMYQQLELSHVPNSGVSDSYEYR